MDFVYLVLNLLLIGIQNLVLEIFEGCDIPSSQDPLNETKCTYFKESGDVPREFELSSSFVHPPTVNYRCGSCWSIVVASALTWHRRKENVEMSWFRFEDFHLSEQMFLDCSRAGSCEGGDTEIALQWSINKPLYTVERFGAGIFEDKQNVDCVYSPRRANIKPFVVGCKKIPRTITMQERIKVVKYALFSTASPLIVNVNWSNDLSSYKNSTPDQPPEPFVGKCSTNPKLYGHSLLLMGWKTLHGRECWIVRNNHNELTWGFRGEGVLGGVGYLPFDAKPNICGILNSPIFPIF